MNMKLKVSHNHKHILYDSKLYDLFHYKLRKITFKILIMKHYSKKLLN